MKAGDKIYVNGANIRVDRKVSLELLNKTKFLLHDHLLPAREVDSPLKQLYFAVQMLIINSGSSEESKTLYQDLVKSMMCENGSPQLRRLIRQIECEITADREYNALKAIRKSIKSKG